MPPKLYLVRHAQGEHNATRNFTIPDPLLTETGKAQCRELQETFEFHNIINLVLTSPLRRAIQTAAYSFGPTLTRSDVSFLAIPEAQEVSDLGCDVGLSSQDLINAIPEMFAGETLKFNASKLNIAAVKDGWNVKKGYYAYTKEALSKRASDLRSWLFNRPEEHIILVSHGAFLHFLTEDWDVDDPMTGTAYNNCELRLFTFTPQSTTNDAHLIETAESKKSRGANEKETDPHVLEELKTVAEIAN